MDDLTADQIREYRGTLTEPGTRQPVPQPAGRGEPRSVPAHEGGRVPRRRRVLRAKIDMASPNMNMRDPTLYRIRHASHHRTGDAWSIYPMYDYAHPIEDALEGITHSIASSIG